MKKPVEKTFVAGPSIEYRGGTIRDTPTGARQGIPPGGNADGHRGYDEPSKEV